MFVLSNMFCVLFAFLLFSFQSISLEKDIHIFDSLGRDNECLSTYGPLSVIYYDLSRPLPPKDALDFFLSKINNNSDKVLEPMCGSGRFILPFMKKGVDITGFDNSSYMVERCQNHLKKNNFDYNNITVNDFNNFNPLSNFEMIFIGRGSICLLIEETDINLALEKIASWLSINGRVYFEVYTIFFLEDEYSGPDPIFVITENNEKIVITKSNWINTNNSVFKSLRTYELWKNDRIIRKEVENLSLRLYSAEEFSSLLEKHGFKILRKTDRYSNQEVNEYSKVIVYECEKI